MSTVLLTPMERRAVTGMEALFRELLARQAQERDAFGVEFNAMLVEIAEAHELDPLLWAVGAEISPDGSAIMMPDGEPEAPVEPTPIGRGGKRGKGRKSG